MSDDLKKKLFECLLELPRKKEELEQLQHQCHTEHLSKQELLAENESLKVEVSSLRGQLDLTNKVLHKCEENLKGAKDAVVTHKLGMEATSRIGDKMKEEAVRLHSKNMALKKQIEKLELEIKTETFYRETCMSKQTKMQATIESLTNQLHVLEKDFMDVEKKSNSTLTIGNNSKLIIGSKNHIIKQMQEKMESLLTQNTSLAGELKNIKLNGDNNKAVEQDYSQDIMKEWQISLNEMKNRKANYEEKLESLYNTLEKTLKDMRKAQEFEEITKKKVRELKTQLQESNKKMCTDCSVQTDLIMSIEVGIQTDSSTGQVKEEDECYNKHPKHIDSTSSSSRISKYSSGAVSELISQIQREVVKTNSDTTNTQLSQSQDDTLLSQLPTQLNTKLVQK